MATAVKQLDHYVEAHSELHARRLKEPAWLQHLRDQAWREFRAKGIPSTHDEDWRFTNVGALERIAFQRAASSEGSVTAGDIAPWVVKGALCRLVFVNGRFAPELSDLKALPTGIEVTSIGQALAHDHLEAHLGRYANRERDAFVALNTGLWEDGALVHAHRGAVSERPVHLLYVTANDGAPVMTHPRTLIVADATSHVAVIEDYVSLGGGQAFSNSVTELVARQDAVVSHYLVERENLDAYNISTLRLEQERGANVSSHSILLGGGLVRNNVHPVLNGEGAECLINGLFVGGGKQHMDNYMLVEHAQPNCSSRQFYNGILDERSRGVFHGRIVVHKDAQHTDAKQTNRNLLLSDDARIDTKPQLEIYADDVKCTHGATIGQIEGEALFYLRSRGISEAEARNLLLYAFAAECLDRMAEGPARKFIEKLIRERLGDIAGRLGAKLPSVEDETEEAQSWEEVG